VEKRKGFRKQRKLRKRLRKQRDLRREKDTGSRGNRGIWQKTCINNEDVHCPLTSGNFCARFLV
jgi:hypothetical protein